MVTGIGIRLAPAGRRQDPAAPPTATLAVTLRLERDDAAIQQCPGCDGPTFTVPCHSCANRLSGNQNGAAL